MSDEFDVVVIGAGPGGYVCAIRCAQLGMKVACIEKRETLGGTCLNVGCIPSKALLESSHHFHAAQKEFSEHGIDLTGVKLQLDKMISRKDKVVKGMTDGIDFLFKKNKIKRFLGHGKISGPQTVEITNNEKTTIKAKKIVVATGSAPIELPMAPFDHMSIVDSTDALKFAKVPKELIVVGGGVIGLEMGSIWSRLGAKVTVIEAFDKLLGPTDKTISQNLLRILKKQGLDIHLNTQLKEVNKKGQKIELLCESKGETVKFKGDKALIAVGRKPYTENLGLENVGIELGERGTVAIDERFATKAEGVYAIGDVVSGPMLAHKAEEEGVALAEILAGQKGHVNYRAIPNVVYTWPEVACVGESEEACKERGLKIKVGKFNFKANGRAKAMGQDDGIVKFIADAQTDLLLGVHIVGPNASELIAEAAIAFEYGASAEDVARSVHAHPTLAETLKEAALDVDKRAIHS